MLGRLLRFAAVGVLNTGIYYGCYLALHAAVPYVLAHVLATAIAMVCSYFLNCYVTFNRAPSWRTFLLFPLSNLANVVVTTAGLPVAVDVLGLDERIAPLPVAVLAIPITYLVTATVMSDGDQRARSGSNGAPTFRSAASAS
jgi:putative flippase GtrA